MKEDAVNDVAATKPAPGKTVTESEFLPDPQATPIPDDQD